MCSIDVEHLNQATLACWAEHQAAAQQRHRLQHEPHASALPEPTRRLVADGVYDTLCSDVTVHELAALTGYSEAQFLRRFKASFRMPPHRYILARRVERAKHLMLASDLTLTAIAQQLGFASHAHFSTAFKLRTGSTPSAFRRQPAPQGRAAGAPCECR
jgi:AraC-like DNA-binding protein